MISLGNKIITFIFLNYLFISKCYSQKEKPTLNRFGRISPKELQQFQLCTTDDECISVTNGLCDCANGGTEVAINRNVSDDFEQIFEGRPMMCTLIGRTLPCGIGSGNTCENNLCVFNACANTTAANSCRRIKPDASVEDIIDCMTEACQAKSESIAMENQLNNTGDFHDEFQSEFSGLITTLPQPPPITNLYNLTFGKLLQDELQSFQSCEVNEDCVYANNGFCDCANGGEQVAVNKDVVDEFVAIFNSTRRPCTKIGSPIPCHIGSGVRCDSSSKLCKFEPCAREGLIDALECDFHNDTMACMEKACMQDR